VNNACKKSDSKIGQQDLFGQQKRSCCPVLVGWTKN